MRPLGSALPIGAHLVTPRRGYTRHGTCIGEGRVVHSAGWSRALLRGPVEEVSLARFADGRHVSVKAVASARLSAAEIIARARSRLGEDRYRLASNNCEHFCKWCLSGQSRSEQVERLVGALRAATRRHARRQALRRGTLRRGAATSHRMTRRRTTTPACGPCRHSNWVTNLVLR